MKSLLARNKNLANILTLSGGTLITQMIGIVSIPLLTWIYIPDHFGLLYSFIGLLQILVLVSTLKLEKAIILPSSHNEGSKVFYTTISIVFGFSLMVMLGLGIVHFGGFKFSFIKVEYIYLIPMAIFSFSSFSALANWNQRNEKYAFMTKLAIVQTSCTFILSLLLGLLLRNEYGLIYGYILGTLLAATWGYRYDSSNIITFKKEFKFEHIKQQLFKHIDFPKYYLPFILFTRGIAFITPVLFLDFFGEKDTGFYSVALKVVMIPVVVLIYGVSNVFLIEAKKQYQLSGEFKKLFISNLLIISVIGLLIYGTIYLICEYILIDFISDDWKDIIPFIEILSLIIGLEFIAQTFKNNVFIVTEKQKIGAYYQGFYALSIIILIYAMKYATILEVLNYHIYITALFSFLTIGITYYLACGKGSENPSKVCQ